VAVAPAAPPVESAVTTTVGPAAAPSKDRLVPASVPAGGGAAATR
jgi:hypothetical protein